MLQPQEIYICRNLLQIFAGTWNVNETKPSRAGLQMWLKERAQNADLVMIGLQVSVAARLVTIILCAVATVYIMLTRQWSDYEGPQTAL